MSEDADRAVLEYLNRANDVAHRYLGSRERVDFITRLRQRIEEHRARAGGATELAQVRKVLARFGDPEVLVRRERRRLDGTNGGDGTDGSAGADGAGADGAGADGGAGADDAGISVAQTTSPAASPVRSGGGTVELAVLFRHYPVEVGAIALTGFGGLLLPVPLWIFGAMAAILSRVWTIREKVIGLVVPPLVAAGAVAATDGADALRAVGTAGVPPLLRLAGPVGAGYLAWRLLRCVGAWAVRFTRARARGR